MRFIFEDYKFDSTQKIIIKLLVVSISLAWRQRNENAVRMRPQSTHTNII